MNQTVDARGMACPLPVVNAKKALESMTSGELTVLVDNEIAVQNLLRFAAQKSFACGKSVAALVDVIICTCQIPELVCAGLGEQSTVAHTADGMAQRPDYKQSNYEEGYCIEDYQHTKQHALGKKSVIQIVQTGSQLCLRSSQNDF